MKKEIIKVKESGQIFKMKEVVGISKKAGTEPHAIVDPNTNELLVANRDIKRAPLEYCADNLRNRDPDPEVNDLFELRKVLYEAKKSYLFLKMTLK